MHPQTNRIAHSAQLRRATVASLLAAMGALAGTAHAANGTYTSQTGAWNLTGSWQDGIVATGANDTAFFTNDVTADRTTNLGGDRTIGHIVFTDADNTTGQGFNRILNNNTLTLDVTTGSPSIDVTQSNRVLRINSALTGNDGFTKTGPGTLILNNGNGAASTNTVTGQIQILQGIIQYGFANQSGIATGAHTVAISGGASLRFRHAGGDILTYNANISGAGSVHMIYNNTLPGGSLTLGGDNTFSGGLTINPNSGTSVLNLKAGSATALGSGNVTITQYGRLDLNGQNPTTGLLIGTAGSVANDAASPSTLTLHSDDATPRTFAGVIQDGSGAASISKSGTGTQIFSGDNTYSNGTTISAGTLLVNNTTGSGTGANTVSVQAAATLGGTGTIAGATTIDGTLASGSNGVGKLTFGNGLAVNGTSVWQIDANNSASGFDSVGLTGGNLTLGDSSVFQINPLSGVDFSDSFWASAQSWAVIDNTGAGTIGGTFSSIGGTVSNAFGSFALAYGSGAGGDVMLNWTPTAIPEPSSFAALAGLGALGIAGLRRRARS